MVKRKSGQIQGCHCIIKRTKLKEIFCLYLNDVRDITDGYTYDLDAGVAYGVDIGGYCQAIIFKRAE